ncbi:SDR family NAD(P)-dependent oxidoreductase [Sphingobium nicotianae]|uniref:SDR family oxidoreductase n=1 Tax=Sphingobium nicotianae TaxID=2782607 RepID=A0A9X1DDA1_9SPHN|nr:SDR family oxidoreductase [Sphingobium nicotianae]
MGDISFSLAGRKAMVIGADSGIGLACARAIANAGADLVIGGIDPGKGGDLAAEIAAKSGTKVSYVAVDVTREEQVAAAVEEAVKRLGGLDVAMNNAGIPGWPGAIQDQTAEQFDMLFAINVRGAMFGMKYQVPHMLKGGKGSIINLASTAAINGLAFCAPYAASKHAVAGLTKSVALELADQGIRVNAIAPGPVNTGLLASMRAGRMALPSKTGGASVPMARVSEPDEMAGAVVWLASDASSYVTGTLVSIDGGVVAV